MTAPKPDLLDAIKALADSEHVGCSWECASHDGRGPCNCWRAKVRALLAGATTSETVEGEVCGAEHGVSPAFCILEPGHKSTHQGWAHYPGQLATWPYPAPVPTEGGEQP